MNLSDNRAYTLYQEGRELIKMGRLEEAVSVLSTSTQLDPHFKTLELLGEVLLELGRFTEAIIPLAAATTLNRQVRAPGLLAKALLACGDRHAARQIALLAAERDPTNRLASDILNATLDLVELP